MEMNDVLSDATQVREPIVESATDEKPSTPVVEAATTSVAMEPEATEVQAQRDDKGRFATDEGKKPETMVPLSALLAERAKRKVPEATVAKTDVFENPDKAIEERIHEATAPIRAQYFNLSMRAAQRSYKDFEDAAKAFADASEKDERLVEQLRSHDDPGEFIYSVGMQVKELSEVGGDFGKYREKIRSEASAELGTLQARIQALEAENATLKSSRDKVAKIPQSLNAEPSGVSRGAEFAGPTPIRSILNS
jgi:hypothetical protein